LVTVSTPFHYTTLFRSYLAACEKADAKYTLPRNFRSASKMVAATNQLFQRGNEKNSEQGVFMHQHIPFENVQAQGRSEQLLVARSEEHTSELQSRFELV